MYRDYADIPENTPTYSFFHDFIPRRSTASACVVQGVKKGEDPAYTTLWSIVGFPLTSIALPTWVKGEDEFPNILKRNDKFNDAPICYGALELKKKLFSIRWGKWAAKYYVNINALINKDNTGIYQKIRPYENKIFKMTNDKLDLWRSKGMKKTMLKEHYNELNQLVIKMFDEEFEIDLN